MVVALPALTLNVVKNPKPVTVTVPVVFCSLEINNWSFAPPLPLAGNVSQKSVPLLSRVPVPAGGENGWGPAAVAVDDRLAMPRFEATVSAIESLRLPIVAPATVNDLESIDI